VSIEQLVRDTLKDHAGDVDVALPGIGARARTQADGIRSQRRTTVGAVVLAAVAVFSVLAVNPFRSGADRIEPAAPDNSVVRTEFAGRTLIGSARTTGGQVLDLTATPPGGSQWQVLCTGVGSQYTVHFVLDGAPEDQAPCSLFAGLGEAPSPGLEAPGYRIPAAVSDGQRRTLRVWVTERDSEEFAHPESATLVAAVYDLPEPLTYIAGWEIQQREEINGEEYSVVEYAEGTRGQRTFSQRLPARNGQLMLGLLAAGSVPSNVTLEVDGEELQPEPDTLTLGTMCWTGRVPPGEHIVTLRIDGEVPADAQLGIVVLEKVP